jgi:mediator of RNA polymerase II transcription subunit 12
MNPSTFSRVVHILHICKAYSSIADFIVRAVRVNDNQEILRITLDIFRCHADTWTAMDRWPVIVDALMERFHRLDRKDIFHPRLPRLIIDVAAQGRAKLEDAEEVRSYVEYHEKVGFVLRQQRLMVGLVCRYGTS